MTIDEILGTMRRLDDGRMKPTLPGWYWAENEWSHLVWEVLEAPPTGLCAFLGGSGSAPNIKHLDELVDDGFDFRPCGPSPFEEEEGGGA